MRLNPFRKKAPQQEPLASAPFAAPQPYVPQVVATPTGVPVDGGFPGEPRDPGRIKGPLPPLYGGFPSGIPPVDGSKFKFINLGTDYGGFPYGGFPGEPRDPGKIKGPLPPLYGGFPYGGFPQPGPAMAGVPAHEPFQPTPTPLVQDVVKPNEPAVGITLPGTSAGDSPAAGLTAFNPSAGADPTVQNHPQNM